MRALAGTTTAIARLRGLVRTTTARRRRRRRGTTAIARQCHPCVPQRLLDDNEDNEDVPNHDVPTYWHGPHLLEAGRALVK